MQLLHAKMALLVCEHLFISERGLTYRGFHIKWLAEMEFGTNWHSLLGAAGAGYFFCESCIHFVLPRV